MHAFVRLAPLLLALAGAAALAQAPATDAAQDLPKDLHGRWTAKATGGRAATQPFDLENIQRKEGNTFAARLSWTTADARCTIRYQPVTGQVTPSGLKFEMKTPCQEALTAELTRGPGGWVGMASNTANPPQVVEITAR